VFHGPPTVREFLQEGFDELFSVDGRLVRSVQYLLLKLGFLTRELFGGRRQRYIRPLRLYLTSVVAFAIIALIPASDDTIELTPPTRVVRAWPSGLDDASAPLAGRPLRDGHWVCLDGVRTSRMSGIAHRTRS
jgi:uncharacterized protein DUF3667